MPVAVVSSLPLGIDDLADLARNKVLVAAAVAGTIGQLAKPLTSAIGGKGIDLRAAVRSGGMPSTHSSAVTATATLLGLERGFSDSIFGMSVVFAALVMYDAQALPAPPPGHMAIRNKEGNTVIISGPDGAPVTSQSSELVGGYVMVWYFLLSDYMWTSRLRQMLGFRKLDFL